MKNQLNLSFLFVCLVVNTGAISQSISVYQYRHVPQENMNEFIKRETTYWSEVAQKAIDKGKLEFWALLVKQGGQDLPNSSNVLFINTYKDIDDIEGIWDTSQLFPDFPMDQLETGSLGYVTSVFFVNEENWVQSSHANPERDFNYLVMIYHNTSNASQFIALEKEHWAPFIKSAMDNKITTQVGWGNARVLSPSGGDIKFNSVSYDLYSTLKEAIIPWDENVVLPNDGFAKLDEISLIRRKLVVYKIVKMIEGSGHN